MCAGRVLVWDVPLSASPVGGSIVDDAAVLSLARALASVSAAAFVLEHTWGVRGQGGSSQYKFGDTAAALRVAFVSAGHRLARVSSQKWTAALRVGSDKAKHVETARALWPADVALFTPRRGVLTQAQCEGRADAALIAEYGRRNQL